MRRRYRQKVLTKPLRKNIISVIATKFIIITKYYYNFYYEDIFLEN